MVWTIHDFTTSGKGYIRVSDPVEGNVCDLFPFAKEGGVGHGRAMEYARKIVNAEQLYDALKGLLDWVKEDCPEGGAYATVEAEAALRNIKPVR